MPNPVTLTGTDVQVRRCPSKEVTAIDNTRMEAFLMFEKGYLPNPEGWLNQPMKFSETMILIDLLMTKMEKFKHGKSGH